MSQHQLNNKCTWVQQLLALVFVSWAIALGLDHLDLLGASLGVFLCILFIAGLNKGKPDRKSEVKTMGTPNYKSEVNHQVNLEVNNEINHQVNHQINPIVVPVEEVVIDSSADLGFSDSEEYGPAPVIRQRIIELSSLSIKSLKSLASKNKLPRYGNMRKSELIAALI
jgi:hypothetical protein